MFGLFVLFFFKPHCIAWSFFNSSVLVLVHPDVKNWIKYARFEEKHGYFAHARKVYERAVEFFGDEHMDERLYVAFAKFEENQKEVSELELNYITKQLRKDYFCAHLSSFPFSYSLLIGENVFKIQKLDFSKQIQL